MAVYIGLFALAVILGIPLAGRKSSKPGKIIYLSVMFVLMFLLSAFRYGMGNDYFSYIRIYDIICSTPWSEITTLVYEPLFTLVTKLISMISTNPEVMYIIYSVLILAPVAYSIYRYSDNVWISVAVYLCFTFFYSSMNFIRQSIAVSILILAYGFIKQRKIIPVMIFAVAAALFHYTAIVFIPFYLLSFFIKPTKKAIIIYSSVSLGALITVLIMKALGANPLNLMANFMTMLTGRDYNVYIDSKWFTEGFGIEYLIMPAAVLAFIMISYFLGWREKEEADTSLWFMLFNASIWSFITFAFIVERFSLFLFIFSIFAIPSVLNYFNEKAEKAAEAEKARKSASKKMPGYSSSKSEEKSDNAFLLTIVATAGMFIYNCWGMHMNFHGVFPYMTNIPALQDAIDGYNTPEDNLVVMYTNADIYTYLIQLKNTDCGYVILSTATDYDGFTPGIRRAADYAGTGLNRPSDIEAKTPFYTEYNDRKGETSQSSEYTAGNGIKIVNDGKTGVVTDSEGKKAEIGSEKLMFVLFDDNGLIFDAMEYEIDQAQRTAAKVEIK
ncbi:MAG: EpsG family protein [Oscillospiraceae bacterium]|nr:EpsG family protein [Oscillospiraceae bacterium]